MEKHKIVKVPRNLSMVIFDKTTCSANDWRTYYKETFENKIFVFLGTVAQTTEHCILGDLDTGKITGMYHTDNFREATDEEF